LLKRRLSQKSILLRAYQIIFASVCVPVSTACGKI
jgi:hypothetical protein